MQPKEVAKIKTKKASKDDGERRLEVENSERDACESGHEIEYERGAWRK